MLFFHKQKICICPLFLFINRLLRVNTTVFRYVLAVASHHHQMNPSQSVEQVQKRDPQVRALLAQRVIAVNFFFRPNGSPLKKASRIRTSTYSLSQHTGSERGHVRVGRSSRQREEFHSSLGYRPTESSWKTPQQQRRLLQKKDRRRSRRRRRRGFSERHFTTLGSPLSSSRCATKLEFMCHGRLDGRLVA